MAPRATFAWTWAAATWAVVAVATDSRHGQCKDPLFQTHWAPKNDIQTLTAFPVVKTNLKLCPYYNQKASCCHQTFESEQHKYYDFWVTMLSEKFLRIAAHRESVISEAQMHGNLTTKDQEQYYALLDAYTEVLLFENQERCLGEILTYIAGMMCFACKPAWYFFTAFEGDDTTAEHVVRVRMERSVCLDLWAQCTHFGERVVTLDRAIRDSRVARSAPRAVENVDMFTGQRNLCDWMHDQVALHPFRLPSKEDRDTGARQEDGLSGEPPTFAARRLTPGSQEMDVLWEGRSSGFDRSWKSPFGTSSATGLLGAARLPAACAFAGLGLLL